MSAAVGENEPITWPTSLYGLASEPGSGRYGERLAVCVRHHGQHVRHGRDGEAWCQSLPPRAPGPRRLRVRNSEPPVQVVLVELGAQVGLVMEDAIVAALRRHRLESAP